MPDNDQRSDLKKDLYIVVPILLICILILIFSDFGRNRTVVYDCRDAHWHPDYPASVRDECRKILQENLKQKQKEEDERKIIKV